MVEGPAVRDLGAVLSATEYLRGVLADGEPHSCTDMAADLGVTVNAIEQGVCRLRRKGVPIIHTAGSYQSTECIRCRVCGRPLSRYNRAGICHRHSRGGRP